MKFLLEVHISTRIAHALSHAGHDVVRAALLDPTALDRELLARAVSEGMIIVTEDSDYSDLIFVRGAEAPPSLIFIRCPPDEQPKMAERVLETIADSRIADHIVVLTPTTTRFRAFPRAADKHA